MGNAGREFLRDDLLARQPVERHDEGAQRVAVGGDDHGAPDSTFGWMRWM